MYQICGQCRVCIRYVVNAVCIRYVVNRAETWAMQTVQAFINRCLRRILNMGGDMTKPGATCYRGSIWEVIWQNQGLHVTETQYGRWYDKTRGYMLQRHNLGCAYNTINTDLTLDFILSYYIILHTNTEQTQAIHTEEYNYSHYIYKNLIHIHAFYTIS